MLAISSKPPTPLQRPWTGFYTQLAILLAGTIHKKGTPPPKPPLAPNNQLPPHSLPVFPFRFISHDYPSSPPHRDKARGPPGVFSCFFFFLKKKKNIIVQQT